MSKRMLIDAASIDETRVVVLDGDHIDVVDFENDEQKQLKSNVYLARIIRVEPSLQAAFVDYGGNRHGFLPFSEIHPDYYQIPAEDREQLINEAAQRLAERQEARVKSQAARKGRQSTSEGTASSDVGINTDLIPAGGVTPPAVAETVATESIFEPFEHDIDLVEQEKGPFISELIPLDKPVGALQNPDGGVDEGAEKADDADLDQENLKFLDGLEAGFRETVGQEARIDDVSRGAAATDHDADFTRDDDDELIDDEEELEGRAILRTIIAGRYKIQDVIKRRQVVLIQVNKEERGNKGAALTTYLSLAGRYCVLMPNTQRGGGISRKIASPKDRHKLKQILSEIAMPSGVSVIVRTAGAERSKAEIRRDYEYLVRAWDEIREKVLTGQAPSLVYEEGNVIKRAVRDLYSRDMDEIIVDGQEGYEAAKSLMRTLTPSHVKKVRPHKSSTPLFLEAGIEGQLDSLHDPVVPLASGGYLVMNQTEALVAVDVNSGKATKEKNIEDTALLTNLEAATEVARQLRLRDMAGLVVIDFIDMLENRHRSQVESRLRDAMKNDRARIQLGRISSFGLLELSRQRLRPSMFESSMQTCSICSGTGLVRTASSFGRAILRRVEQLAKDSGKDLEAVEVTVPFNVGLLILNQLRSELMAMESRLGCNVLVVPDTHSQAPSFRIAITAAGSETVFEEGKSKRASSPRGQERRAPNARTRRGERGSNRSSQDGKDAQNSKRKKENNFQSENEEALSTAKGSNDGEAKGAENKRSSRRNSQKRRKTKDGQEGGDTAVSPDLETGLDDSLSDSSENQVSAPDGSEADDEQQQGRKKGRRRGNRGGRRRSKKDENADQLVEATIENTALNGSAESFVSSDLSSSSRLDAGEQQGKIKTESSLADGVSQLDAVSVKEDTPPKEGAKKRGWFSRARDALTSK